MRRAAVCALAALCGFLSSLIHWLIYGYWMALCARAWLLRDLPFWARWVRIFDRLCRAYEPDHTRASFERWMK